MQSYKWSYKNSQFYSSVVLNESVISEFHCTIILINFQHVEFSGREMDFWSIFLLLLDLLRFPLLLRLRLLPPLRGRQQVHGNLEPPRLCLERLKGEQIIENYSLYSNISRPLHWAVQKWSKNIISKSSRFCNNKSRIHFVVEKHTKCK